MVSTQTCGYALWSVQYTVMQVRTLEWSVYSHVGTHSGVVCTQTCGYTLHCGLYTNLWVLTLEWSVHRHEGTIGTPEWSIHSHVGRHSSVVYSHREVCVEKLCPYTDLSGRRIFTQMGYR